MALFEKTGFRDQAYSAWHRVHSVRRFVGLEAAQTLSMIDLDAAMYVEYGDDNKEPLALIETAVDVGQKYKNATVTKNLARRAGLRAYTVLYKLSDKTNPADPKVQDIEQFRVRQIWPTETDWKILTPEQWSRCIIKIRRDACAELERELVAAE